MKEISTLGLRVKIIPILTTLHKNLLLNEIPLGGLSLLLDAIKEFQCNRVRGSSRSQYCRS